MRWRRCWREPRWRAPPRSPPRGRRPREGPSGGGGGGGAGEHSWRVRTFPPSGTGRRTSTALHGNVHSQLRPRPPGQPPGTTPGNPAAVPPVAMTLDANVRSHYPRITAMAASSASSRFRDRMYKAAVEAANEKASASPGGTKRRGPRGVNAGAVRRRGLDSHRGPSDLPTGGDDIVVGPRALGTDARVAGRLRRCRRAPAIVERPARRGRETDVEALARRKSVGPGSSPGPLQRTVSSDQTTRPPSRRRHSHGGGGEYWTAAGEDSAGEFGDLGTDPDAFVATARRGGRRTRRGGTRCCASGVNRAD